jgi:hypothetical protein
LGAGTDGVKINFLATIIKMAPLAMATFESLRLEKETCEHRQIADRRSAVEPLALRDRLALMNPPRR